MVDQGEGSEQPDKLTINEFLESNYHLFNVLSVFGAIALFLTTVQEAQTSISLNIGVVASLSLFLIICGIVNIRYVGYFLVDNIDRAIATGNMFVIHVSFILLFDTLSISILLYTSSFGQSLLWVVAIFTLVISGASSFKAGLLVERKTRLGPTVVYLIFGIIYVGASSEFDLRMSLPTTGYESVTAALTWGILYGMFLFYGWDD